MTWEVMPASASRVSFRGSGGRVPCAAAQPCETTGCTLRAMRPILLFVSLLVACDGGSTPDAGGAPGEDAGPTTPDTGAPSEDASLASTEDPELAAALESLRAAHDLPALAAAEFVDGELRHQAAVGVRRLGDDTPVTLEDRWHLGSCTKAMTATLAAILFEEGVASWDTTVVEVLGSRVSRPIHPAFAGVTFRHLMSHRAGFATDFTAAAPESWAGSFGHNVGPIQAQRLAYAEEVLSSAPELTPGTAFQYSNIGYIVAGAMLEQLTGQTWEELMRTRLFAPLGMEGCGFGVQATAAVEAPWPHTDASPPVPTLEDNPPGLGPAGTVYCPLAGWAPFLALHVDGWRGEPTPVLTTASFEVLHSGPMLGPPPDGFDYGQGWGLTTQPWAGVALSHSGSNTLNFAFVVLAPELDRFMVAVTNRGGASAETAMGMAVDEMVRLYY